MVPADLSELGNRVDNDVVKNTVYDKLVIKVNLIDTKMPGNSGLVTKTQYELDKQGFKKKIEDVDEKDNQYREE